MGTSMPHDNNFSFSQSIPSSPTSSAPSVTHSSTPTLTAVPTSIPSVIPSSLPSVMPSLLPSSLPSVKPSSLPSVYVCKDVTDEVAFTRKNKGWSCIKLRVKQDKKIKKICKDIVDAQRQCAITCNSCFSNSPSLATSAPIGVCKDDDDFTFKYKDTKFTCETLSDRRKENIEKICRKKQKKTTEPFCPLTCGACIPLSPTPSVIPSSLDTSAPIGVCKDDDDFTFEYNGRDFTCEKLSSRKETNIERICRKKKRNSRTILSINLWCM